MDALKNIKQEDQFAFYVTAGIHAVLILFFILYTFSLNKNVRPSFIEVEFGEYQSGTQTEFAKEKKEKVAASPNPSKVQPEKPKPDQPKPKEEQVKTTEKTTKPVDVPDQKEEVKEKELKTPETDKVDPEKKTADKTKKEVVIPPKARQAEKQQQGAKNSGDKKGTTGQVDTDQGRGNEKQKSAPYNLHFEGLNRDPLVQPLPQNTSGYNATIVVKFEVTPDGKVTNIIPLRKSGNPKIDRKVIQTLNSWRFSHLPADVPQQNQKGTITFRFVVD